MKEAALGCSTRVLVTATDDMPAESCTWASQNKESFFFFPPSSAGHQTLGRNKEGKETVNMVKGGRVGERGQKEERKRTNHQNALTFICYRLLAFRLIILR